MPEPIRWGILGTARINRKFVPGLHGAGHTVAIVGSRNPERARTAATEYRAERAGTYEDVLTAPDVDVVYISLPNSLHAFWTIRAAEAGKHVLCEKPLAPNVADCEAMVAACQKHGVHLIEAFMYRYHPQWRVVWQTIKSGSLGQIQLLRASFEFPLHDRRNIRLSSELVGGALQDVGCYCVNVARWFLGEPTQVRGVATDRQGVGVDTHDAAVLEHESGALSILSCSFETARLNTVELIGDRGRIEVPNAFVTAGDTRIRIVDDEGDRFEMIPNYDAYAREAAAVERLIRKGTPVLTPAEDAARTQAVIAAWSGSN